MYIQYWREGPTVDFPENTLLNSYTYSSIWKAQVLCEQNLACSSFILVRRNELERGQLNAQSPNKICEAENKKEM